jgi:membrane protein
MDLRAMAAVAWDVLTATWAEWSEDRAPRLGAALAYYTAFSIAPLLVIAIAIAGLLLGEEAARGQIVAQIAGLVGPDSARAIQDMIANAQRPASGVIATALGTGTLLLGASGVFGQLQDALNTIWEVESKPGRGLRGMLRDRFFSFTMVLGTGFLLLVSLILTSALSGLTAGFADTGPVLETLGHALDLLLSLAVTTLLFALIYRYIPDVKIAWNDVWVGAALTAVLFAIGKTAIGLYLGRASVGSAYGAAGSLVVLLAWVYYAAQILLFGAELTQVYANRWGSRVEPADNAVRVTEGTRVQQGMPPREVA